MKKYPILILHGWNLSGKKFKPLKEILEKNGYRVLSPDLPGFGENTFLSKPLVLNDYVKFVYDYLKRNNINRVILIGHSFGGRIAIKFTSDYQQRVKFLILSGVPGFVPVNRLKITLFFFISKIGGIIFKIPPFIFFQEIARRFLYKLAGTRDYMYTKGELRITFKSIIKEDLIQYMKKIKVGTLLIWGQKDRTVPLFIARKMEKVIIGAKLIIIPNAFHNLPYVQPEKFMKAIKDYIYT